MSLQEFFVQNYDGDTLASFVKLCAAVAPTTEKLTRKDQRAKYLVDTLQDRKVVAQLWEQMDDLSHKAVASAYHSGGEFVADAFIAQYGSLPERPQNARWYYMKSPILLDLFIHHGQIPPELMAGLAGLVPPPERFQVEGVPDIPAVLNSYGKLTELRVAETEQSGWHDLLLFLQLVDQHTLKLKNTGEKLTSASVATLLENLLQGDFFSPADLGPDPLFRVTGAQESVNAAGKANSEDAIRPFGLTVFAHGAGLITNFGRGGLTELGRAFLTRQEPEVLLEAFEKWTKESAFDEITRIDAISGLRSRGIRLSKPGMRRERIIEALSWCPVDVWISIKDFYRGLKIWRFDFQIEEGGLYKLHIGYRYGSTDYYEPWASSEEMWWLTNGLYINAVLWEYLAVIGAVDIAYLPPGEIILDTELYTDYDEPYYSRYDGLFYFRINALGAYLFGQAGDYQAETATDAPLLRIDASGFIQILDAARMTPVVKSQLDQIATPEGKEDYRLDSQKVLLALEEAADLAAMRDFLARHSAQTLPPEVSSWLDQVEIASRAFSVDAPMLRIRVASNDLVQLVLADAELGKFCQPLGNRALIIPANRENRFRLRLRELGYGVR